MRKSEGSVLCSSCRRLIHVSEKTCPHCGAVAPSLFGFSPILRRYLGENADLPGLLITVNLALFVLSLALDPRVFAESAQSFSIFTALSPSSEALYTLGMTGGVAITFGCWWTVLTASFLHGGLMHIVFNVMWTRNLGGVAVEAFGPARMMVLWLLTGVGGFVLSNEVSGAPTIGASCSLYGMMGALVVWGRRRGGSIGANISRQLLVWAGIGTLFAFGVGGVNHWGHLGGFLTGLLLGAVTPMAQRSQETRLVQLFALGLILLTVGGFVASAARLGPMMLGGP
ncbi:rhomboid family intramembrane serine protease [Myxococcota bacterium]|nr:rhomboid family intramembrane serine protease [Myxococcota bacterium]